jgi:hypothetical protein
MLLSSSRAATVLQALVISGRLVVVSLALAALSACGVVSAAGSVAGGAVDLTVGAVGVAADVVTAPL